jgi:hypothetical protein
MGHHAYNFWQAANGTGDGWNGFTPFFVGVNDLPEYYTESFLLEQARTLGPKQFKLQYPATVEDLYTQRDLCCFDHEHLRDCTYPDYATGCERYLHGVDTAEGMSGGDWQVCVTLGWKDGVWREVASFRERVPEEVFAEHVDEHVRRYPGTTVVEANVGSAVLAEMRRRGTPGMYKHKHKEKDGVQRRKLGFQTTYQSKRIMITDLKRALREGEIGITTDWIIEELRDFEWKEDSRLAGAPDRTGAHDDGAMALMLALQGAAYQEAGRAYV